jgi:hypothetical protein
LGRPGLAGVFILLLTCACSGAQEDSDHAVEIDRVRQQKVTSQFAHPMGSRLSPFNKDGTAKPPFREEDTRALNAIVERSERVVAELDRARLENRQLSETRRVRLAAEAQQAREDFQAQARSVMESGNYYDQPILAGMATFVAAVESEVLGVTPRAKSTP